MTVRSPGSAGASKNFGGYQKKIMRDVFFEAFETYETGCAPVIQELARGVAPESRRSYSGARPPPCSMSWRPAGRRRATWRTKIVLAIFFVPMVRKQQLPISEEFVTILQKQWVERYPKSPFYLGDYESISGGFRKKFLGLCFITTAVCQELGKPDDCEELTAFRAFRDGYLRSQPDGEALIREYYNIAPGIVTCINTCSDRHASARASARNISRPAIRTCSPGATRAARPAMCGWCGIWNANTSAETEIFEKQGLPARRILLFVHLAQMHAEEKDKTEKNRKILDKAENRVL